MPREGPEPILPAHDLNRTRQFYESLIQGWGTTTTATTSCERRRSLPH